MKHYIYVAGHDYAYKGVDFSQFAWARMARQAAKDTSKEDRDAVIASGMEAGMQVSYDRLEDLAIGPADIGFLIELTRSDRIAGA